MEKGNKYQAVELAMSILRKQGYTVDDSVYRNLVRERARLEITKKEKITIKYDLDTSLDDWDRETYPEEPVEGDYHEDEFPE